MASFIRIYWSVSVTEQGKRKGLVDGDVLSKLGEIKSLGGERFAGNEEVDGVCGRWVIEAGDYLHK